MDFDEALQYMQGLVRFGWKLGNERITELCRLMGDPQRGYPIIHVAGTKGKGSTTALAAAILSAAGARTGSYFSPYVYDVRERVQVDAQPISKTEFAALVTRASPVIEELAKTDFGQTTEFELKTLVGFLHFAAMRVNYACIEVGLGGRLDATNVVEPASTVITNIGLDHTQILGDTHELIAAEKAGIIKTGVPCVTAVDHAGALQVIRRIAQDRDARLVQVQPGPAAEPTGLENLVHWEADAGTSSSNGGFRVATPERVYAVTDMAMRGAHQRVNAACAIASVEIAFGREHPDRSLPEDAMRLAMARTQLPGRLEMLALEDGRFIVLDGAHNQLAAEAIRAPLAEMRKQYDIRRTFVVIGMLTGHDPLPVARALLPGATAVFACSPMWKRALPVIELADAIAEVAPIVWRMTSVKAAVLAALQESRCGDMILITGSFYTVGEASPEWIRSQAAV